MLSGLKIGNFKAFSAAQEVPLRPLTLVFGPNSAGKSSIIQALLLARHIQDTGNVDAHQTTLGGGTVDLGGFKRFIRNHRSESKVELELIFPSNWPTHYPFLGVMGDMQNIRVCYTLAASHPGAPRPYIYISAATIRVDGPELLHLVRSDAEMMIVDQKRGCFARSNEWNSALGVKDGGAALRWACKRKHFWLRGLAITASDNVTEYSIQDASGVSVGVFDDLERYTELYLKAHQEPAHEDAVRAMAIRIEFEFLIEEINRIIQSDLSAMEYLGPLRWIPPRFIPEGEQFDASWRAGGGDAWQSLRREKELRDRVNHFLQDALHSNYRLRAQRFAPVNDAASSTCAAEELAMRSASGDEGFTELQLVDANSGLRVSHRDVGTGISQLLPVLVNAAGLRESLVMIEQPELHLHPALQAELGDVFIESALGENKNTFLIETHSEHLILRIMRRIRESNAGRQPETLPKVRPEDVAILFVQPTENGSVVKHLRVDERGRLIDAWPGGFFEESFDEIF